MSRQLHPVLPSVARRAEAGFSLIEALSAVLILSFGLMAITNLFLVAGTSNQVANQSTGATTQAAEVMERLMLIPFDQLTPGGSLERDLGSISTCNEDSNDCVIAGNWNARRTVFGVGMIRTRWVVQDLGAGGATTYFIKIRSEAIGTLSPQRTRQELTMFRSCTSSGCP